MRPQKVPIAKFINTFIVFMQNNLINFSQNPALHLVVMKK
jgi:hypothetical protein